VVDSDSIRLDLALHDGTEHSAKPACAPLILCIKIVLFVVNEFPRFAVQSLALSIATDCFLINQWGHRACDRSCGRGNSLTSAYTRELSNIHHLDALKCHILAFGMPIEFHSQRGIFTWHALQ
jgi:hypothetical protein